MLTTPILAARALQRRGLPVARRARPPVPSVGAVSVGLLAVGVLFRLRAYLHGRSLWLDEVYLALNLVPRSYADLLRPLDHDQGAPLGFLFASKFLVQCCGPSEYVLRLLPFACGVASLFLFRRVARQLLAPAAACFALAVFAAVPKLIYYSNELKQYSSDVCIALALLAACARQWAVRPTPCRLGPIAVLGALAVWCSHPSVFVLAGLGTTLAAEASLRRQWRRLGGLALVGAGWLASFGVCYLVSLRQLAGNEFLQSYWTENFARLPPRHLSDLGWIVRAFCRLFEGPAGLALADVSFSIIGVVVYLIGLAVLARRNGGAVSALTAPLGFTLVASALHRYPFGGRLMLFAVPLLVLVLGAAYEVAAARFSEGHGWPVAAEWVPAVCCGLVLAAPLGTSLRDAKDPLDREEARLPLAFLRNHIRDGDGVYLSAMAQPAFDYYAPRFGLDPDALCVGVAGRNDWPAIHADLQRLTGRERLWVFITHDQSAEHRFLLFELDQLGVCREKCRAPGAAVYLYEFGK